ncbi:hypothetical protein ACHAWF_005858 [Thalassiosira exigua]
MKSSIIVAAATTTCAHAFVPSSGPRTLSTSLNMGLFDGVKEAFGADGMGELDGDRETPIDRWMGWNSKSMDSPQDAVGSKAPVDFIDSMDSQNYITTSLQKPMGIVFEENDSEFGGIFALEINEGSSAAADGTVRPGDQLVSVGGKKVSGLQFEVALGTIIDSTEEKIELVFFRGPAKFLYGAAGASQEWLDEFIKGGEKVEAA